MARVWVLEADVQSSGKGNAKLWLGLKDGAGKIAEVTAPCGSLEELSQEISTLKNELDGMLEAAGKKFTQAGAKPEIESPAEAWKKMEAMGSEQEMFDYYNALSTGTRQQIAEYVFSNVNMFKGRGPVFSEHYDSDGSILE